MTNKLDELMATKAMGWHRPDKELFGQLCWVEIDDSDLQEYLVNWHPTVNLNQAMMCAESFCTAHELMYELIFNLDKSIYLFWILLRTEPYKKNVHTAKSLKKLPLAICSAIKEAIDV